MGPGETLALFALAGMVIGVSIAASEMFNRFLAYKEKKLVAMRQDALDTTDRRTMEQRLQVLERIITDKGYDVAHQIEALRTADGTPTGLVQKEHA